MVNHPSLVLGNAAIAAVLAKSPIGEGAIIGAGAVVNRDIPAFAKAAGVPVRVIGSRKQTEEGLQ
jgi:acetyltransferase-like isoleucine patch superfamily enzyme